MTLSHALADRALAPLSLADADRLRTLTLTNLAAAVGEVGRMEQLISSMPFDPARAGDAAFLHGMRLHARTQDDFHPGGRVHVGAVALATTLALAEAVGESLLECLAAGYETMCAVSSLYSPDAQRRGLRPTGVFGPIGAAASAGMALGLDRDGIANAIGLAAARSGGTTQSWVAGTDEWLLEIGAAARAGVEAALFTRAGAVAAPDALEGGSGWLRAYFGVNDPAQLEAAVTRPERYIGEVAVKPYPVSGIAQVPTDLGRRAHEDIQGRPFDSVTVRLSELEVAYPGSTSRGPFRSRSAALMSVGFCVSCTLADGVVRLARLEAPDELTAAAAGVDIVADSSLEESEAVLALDIGPETHEYHGEGSLLLFPSWETITGEVSALAARSEAEEALVHRAMDHLGVTRPDARRVSELLGGTS